ncbi:MAG: fumarylacetoacetate hydrolase family protein [Anaerolineae bacterium]|nr:fumarylacetoacetate hydrolase family protein [Anaerolineae bacterium]
MRYLTFSAPGNDQPRLGALLSDNLVVDLTLKDDYPNSMLELLQIGSKEIKLLNEQLDQTNPEEPSSLGWQREAVKILPPVPEPPSLRDFYAFEQHVATAYANRGREVPKAWYEMPVFYFSNPQSAYGHEDEIPMPSYTQALDYELEVGAVIGQPGRDIPAEKAMEHIFGFTNFNDWSARDEQRREMSVGLGPAKGKDFASSFGPYLVTPDELDDRSTGRPGVYDLEMVARVNGEERSRGNWKDLYYSFGEMIARASADVWLQSGDIIGSGTVGTGCLLELTKGNGPWLKKGDIVELEIERLGLLRNTVI